MPARFMPTWRERTGIGVVPRTDTVPDAETPLAETLIVVKPARSGLTTPAASTVATVGSALSQTSVGPATVAPDESFACAGIGVGAPMVAAVMGGNESAVTLV